MEEKIVLSFVLNNDFILISSLIFGWITSNYSERDIKLSILHYFQFKQNDNPGQF